MPCAFLGHGTPLLARDGGPWGEALRAWASPLRPTTVLVVSAHWRAPKPTLTGGRLPGVLHDFIGHPAELYELGYAAPGHPEMVLRTLDLLSDCGIAADVDPQRPLDHGAWSPLRWMFPSAEVPVVQLSLPHGLRPPALAELGLALAPLREEGVLILGSGGLVHHPQRLRPGAAAPEGWAVTFDLWMAQRLAQGEFAQAMAYRTSAPFAELAAPTPEHLDPLFVAWGAADGQPARTFFEGWEAGNLSLRSVAWDAGAP
jgi:4,5-DOPA dioxygenase extradiol